MWNICCIVFHNKGNLTIGFELYSYIRRYALYSTNYGPISNVYNWFWAIYKGSGARLCFVECIPERSQAYIYHSALNIILNVLMVIKHIRGEEDVHITVHTHRTLSIYYYGLWNM